MIGDKMSEQMTSRDIEDVLQSIRRLVSEDLRPAARDDRGGARLILTPALRVVDGQAAAEPARPPAEPRVDLVVAALDRALRASPGQWEAETGDPAPPLRLETPVHTPVAPRAVAEAPPARPEPELFLNDADLRDFAPAVLPGEDAGAGAEAAAELAAPDPAAPDPAETRRDPDWSAAAEAAARAELEEGPKVAPMPPEDAGGTGEGTTAEDTAWLDEEALREIVRRVLREELSGPLGERITRNIRKLVHAEIARALALRDGLQG